MVQLTISFLIISFVIEIVSTSGDDASITTICKEQKNCRSCIRVHHACNWCYEQDFKGDRCNLKNNEEFSECRQKCIEHNTETSVNVRKNENFSDVGKDTSAAIQLRPGEFDINLRVDEPVNISIEYRPAKNYHFDLYYLMDLTISMKSKLDTLRKLGKELTDLLTSLTTNYRIAFGSYIDKPEMPFYLTDPENYENPCRMDNWANCERAYLFKHKLNFTSDIDKFIDQVNKSRISANSDNLEGGVDALMQIILCGKKMGWSESSRKLVIIATDGEMHFAGDGILAGYIKRNSDKCLIDKEGNYISHEKYDYPSLEEVHHQLKNKKTNLLVAANYSVVKYYEEMADRLKGTIFVGELNDDSRNVLDLVKDGYYAFMRQVSLFMNTSSVNGLKVDFFADCNGEGKWERKSTCNNAEEGKEMKFKAQFLLTEYQYIDSEVLYIEENNIYDKIKVNARFVGSKCNCPNLEDKSDHKCIHGEYNCGSCICNDGWIGSDCSQRCDNDFQMCRSVDNGTLSLTCFGHGDCICSKCECMIPFSGQFCEYKCPYDSTSRICGGHGICDKGECKCYGLYGGRDCTCLQSEENCKAPGDDTLCTGNGDCKCNKCVCRKGYSGQYCEYCDECKGLCGNFEQNVIDHIEHKNLNMENKTIHVSTVEDLTEDERSCVYRYNLNDGRKCDVFYKYKVNKDRSVDVKAMEPVCNKPLSAAILAFIIIGAILALGALIIIVWKGRNVYRDRIEYQEFVKNRENNYHSEQNPLYRSPVTTYQNVIELRSLHNKTD